MSGGCEASAIVDHDNASNTTMTIAIPIRPANYRFAFFESIGNPKLVVAPMVDHSELPYRMLTRKYGAQLVFTQMFSSNCWVQSMDYKHLNFSTCPEDRPLIIQFAGNDPQTMLKAAKSVENCCDAIDINLGCPQGIAKRGHYGAFLMEELELLHDIVSTLSKGLKVPVTCKTRIYRNDFERSVRLCETLVSAGASMLTIHGRGREEKGSLVGDVDWDMIKKLKQHFGDRVPIIANGGIETIDDVHRCLEHTGAEGVMSSEAILENPALFHEYEIKGGNEERTLVDIAGEYLQLVEAYPGTDRQIKIIRNHLMKFLYRYYVVHEDLRNRTAEEGSIEAFKEIVRELKSRVGSIDEDKKYTESWYNRYRSTLKSRHKTMENGQWVNWQQKMVHSLHNQFWDSVDCEEGGNFDCLGMFSE